MITEFEIRLVTNHTLDEMYASTSSNSEPVRIPSDTSIQYLNGGDGIKIPVAENAGAYSLQSFPILCLRNDNNGTIDWLTWGYFFTESTSGSPGQLTKHYHLHRILFTTSEMPDSADMIAHYGQAVEVACISRLEGDDGLQLPTEFGVQVANLDINGFQVRKTSIWIIGDITTGVID